MLYLHKTLNDEKFKDDKKLKLYRNGVITEGQFRSLISEEDDYVVFGPVLIDKTKIKEFIEEWKNRDLEMNSEEYKNKRSITFDEITEGIDQVLEIYPEVSDIVEEFKEAIKISSCSQCTQNNYISKIVVKINNMIDEGDDRLTENKESDFIKLMLSKYNSVDDSELFTNDTEFDVEWIVPENLLPLGNDFIDNLGSCFDCVMKHIGRAKALYEEFELGYKNHKDLMFEELAKGNKAIEQAYLKYLDSCSQLDMGSCELVGNISNLNKDDAGEMIELANEIRRQRILFQENVNNIPDFDKLRILTKKLQLKLNK